MEHPRLFVQNFFSTTQFPLNAVTAEEEMTGYPATRVGRGSRHVSNNWQPTTANSATWIQARNKNESGDVARAADMIVLDRGHNLEGVTITLYGSDTGAFGGEETTIFTATIPSSVSSGGSLTAANGVLTPERAWLKAFTSQSFKYWRLSIPAMGADKKPLIVGLYLGPSWAFAQPQDDPFIDETYEISWSERTLDSLWIGAGVPRRRRVLQMRVRLENDAEYTKYRDNVLAHYSKRRPMWVIFDPGNNAERATLFVPRARALIGFGFQEGWPERMGSIEGLEHEPKPEH